MLGYKRIVIAQNERGLHLHNRKLVNILEPGVFRIFDPLRRHEIQKYDLTVAEFSHPWLDVLLTTEVAPPRVISSSPTRMSLASTQRPQTEDTSSPAGRSMGTRRVSSFSPFTTKNGWFQVAMIVSLPTWMVTMSPEKGYARRRATRVVTHPPLERSKEYTSVPGSTVSIGTSPFGVSTGVPAGKQPPTGL